MEKRIKKGKKSWKPASMLEVDFPEVEGYRLRWCDKDPGRIAKKEREGWTMVNKITGLTVEHVEPGKIHDGSKLTSLQEYRDLVLMAIPEEHAQARDEYYQEKTNQQTLAPKSKLYQQARDTGGDRAANTVEGSVKIGRTIIE